jgi:hypothetical protein
VIPSDSDSIDRDELSYHSSGVISNHQFLEAGMW